MPLCLMIGLTCSGISQEFVSDSLSILKVLSQQEKAWNTGDIPAFMNGYWHSDKLVFVGAEGPKYGWQNVLDDYHVRYPDRTAMGQLTFTSIELVKLDHSTARQIGKFHLSRSIGDLEGYFTLIWKAINDQWLIVSDHTSASQ